MNRKKGFANFLDFEKIFEHKVGTSGSPKGAVSRDFLSYFLFRALKPSGPLINRLNRFYLKIRFHEDIREISVSLQC